MLESLPKDCYQPVKFDGGFDAFDERNVANFLSAMDVMSDALGF